MPRAYWVTAPGRGELRSEDVPRTPRAWHSIVETIVTGVSPGTERLVGLGRVPAECDRTMACRSMAGSFALPVKYGYSLVGRAVAGSLAGRRVFVMHPHQDRAEVADEHATVLPDTLPSARATLLPNLETALNAAWDAGTTNGERALVVGAGVVGVLVAFVLHRGGAGRVPIVERDPRRAAATAALPWVGPVLAPEDVRDESADLAFDCSGSEGGLHVALRSLAFEGRAIALSWLGADPVRVELGTHFHFRRLSLISSQVGAVARARRETHGPRERVAEVVRLLADGELDLLAASPVPFGAMPELMAELYAGRVGAWMPTIEY